MTAVRPATNKHQASTALYVPVPLHEMQRQIFAERLCSTLGIHELIKMFFNLLMVFRILRCYFFSLIAQLRNQGKTLPGNEPKSFLFEALLPTYYTSSNHFPKSQISENNFVKNDWDLMQYMMNIHCECFDRKTRSPSMSPAECIIKSANFCTCEVIAMLILKLGVSIYKIKFGLHRTDSFSIG